MNGQQLPGELRDSMTEELYAKQGETFDVIVFDRWLNWGIYKKISDTEVKYLRTIPVTPENTQDPWEEETNEGTIIRQKTFNFYVLPVKDMQFSMPKVIGLKKAAFFVGQKMQMIFAKLAAQKKSSASVVLQFSPVKTQKDNHIYFIADFKQGRDATNEEIACAYSWYQKLKRAKNIIIDGAEAEDQVSSSVKTDDNDDIAF
jgi:hypothetical protein